MDATNEEKGQEGELEVAKFRCKVVEDTVDLVLEPGNLRARTRRCSTRLRPRPLTLISNFWLSRDGGVVVEGVLVASVAGDEGAVAEVWPHVLSMSQTNF